MEKPPPRVEKCELALYYAPEHEKFQEFPGEGSAAASGFRAAETADSFERHAKSHRFQKKFTGHIVSSFLTQDFRAKRI